MKYAEKLRRLAEERRLSRMDVVRITGLKKSSVYNYFDAKTSPDIASALKLARVLGVSLDYLADDALDDPPAPQFTDEERQMIEAIRRMGHDIAWRRLLGLPLAGGEYRSNSDPAGGKRGAG